MADVLICGVARTPFGRFGGRLRDATLPELGAHAVNAAMDRATVDVRGVDELIIGVNLPGADRSIARQVSLQAGLPEELNSYSVDRACCSSLAATSLGDRAIRSGDAQVVVAGGTENLSATPYYVQDMRWGNRLGDVTLRDQLVLACPYTSHRRAEQADWSAAAYGITFEQANAWALRSHDRAAKAQDVGHLAEEIVPYRAKGQELGSDEEIRPDTTMEDLAALQPVYGTERITPGNAPGLSTGGAALVLASEEAAVQRDLPVRGRLLAAARASGHPDALASMPAVAAEQALDRAGLAVGDMHVIEINEAFAVVPLISTLCLAGGDPARAETLRARTNVNGGAVALGHPTGASGVRLVMTALMELGRRGGGRGLVTMCGGIGEAEAVVLEVDAAGSPST